MSKMVKSDLTGKQVCLNDGCLMANTDTGDWFFCAIGEQLQVANRYVLPEPDRADDLGGFIDILSDVSTKPWFNAEKFFSIIKSIA